jgi:hypothetical protein
MKTLNMKKTHVVSLITLALLGASTAANANCGGAFCALNTDLGIQGTWTKPGLRLDVRAEYVDLDELRKGTHRTEPAGELGEHDELRTINRNFIAQLNWNIDQDWGVSFRIPLVNRFHKHIFNADDGSGGVDPELENWRFTSIGDISTTARYTFFHGDHSAAGINFGVKLPTGSIHKSNGEEEAERGLQPGTGSTDAIVGAYYNYVHGDMRWFAQGASQSPISERNDYRPGTRITLDGGLGYAVTPALSLQLQANYLHKAHDRGANAEPSESGGDTLSISPGVAYKITPDTQLYGYLQKPIYQYVRGTQLTADWSAAFGISTAF